MAWVGDRQMAVQKVTQITGIQTQALKLTCVRDVTSLLGLHVWMYEWITFYFRVSVHCNGQSMKKQGSVEFTFIQTHKQSNVHRIGKGGCRCGGSRKKFKFECFIFPTEMHDVVYNLYVAPLWEEGGQRSIAYRSIHLNTKHKYMNTVSYRYIIVEYYMILTTTRK